jgi:biotin carboxyl carrier protein
MPKRVMAALNGLVLLVGLLLVAGPVGARTDGPADAPPAAAEATTGTSVDGAVAAAPVPPTEPTTAPEPVAEATPAVPTPEPPAAPPPPPRAVTAADWAPYATVGPVVLHAPGDVVEAIGFHQSRHDGAQPQQPVPSAVRAGLLDGRGRDTHPQGAADIVVDPARPVRSPVTGTVLRAGTYTLYCDHVDHYLVVEPDARPGWEVKVLHFEGLRVAAGERVEAGVTVVGSGARVLPFRSQVDDHTAAPHWPHLHVEVVDPSVPDRPSGGGC